LWILMIFFFNSYSDYIYKLCHKHGLQIENSILLNNLEAAMLAAQSGDGILLLPSHMKDVRFSKLIYVPLSNEEFFIDVVIAYKSENENIAIKPFISLCNKILNE
jgi:DNA-binding transcriptional LysR family regulator